MKMNNKMDRLIKMLENGGESFKKAKDLMSISVKYEFALGQGNGRIL